MTNKSSKELVAERENQAKGLDIARKAVEVAKALNQLPGFFSDHNNRCYRVSREGLVIDVMDSIVPVRKDVPYRFATVTIDYQGQRCFSGSLGEFQTYIPGDWEQKIGELLPLSTEFVKSYKALESLCEAYKTDKPRQELADQAAQIVTDLGSTREIRGLPQSGSGVIVLYEEEQMAHTEGIYLTGDGAVYVVSGMNPDGSSVPTIDPVERSLLSRLFSRDDGAKRAESLKRTLDRRFQ